MSIQPIALLGNPVLRVPCSPVREPQSASARKIVRDLTDTLHDFRRRTGFGRGISAPQIGAGVRIICIDHEFRGALINPTIRRRSRKMFRLWDDCFSFPDLLVEVRRHLTVDVEFLDGHGRRQQLRATGGLSELLQHEIDNLDGVLAIDRAISPAHIVLRSEFNRHIQPASHLL